MISRHAVVTRADSPVRNAARPGHTCGHACPQRGAP